MVRRMAIALACIATGHGVAHAGAWGPYGIPDQPPQVFATHATQGGVAFAGYGDQALGTGAINIVVSSDAGAHWKPAFRFDPSTIPYVDDPTAFVVGSPPQIFANLGTVPWWSSDLGRSWAPVPWVNYPPSDKGSGYRIGAVNPSNPDERVTYFEGWLALTADAGATWQQDFAPFIVKAMEVDWVSRRIYVGGTSSFAAKALGSAEPWIVQSFRSPFAAKAGVVVAKSGNGLVRSPDGGATFVPVGQALGTLGVCAIAFAPSSDAIAYALDCGANLRVLKSIDGGATWTAVGTIAPEIGGSPAVPEKLAIDGTDPALVWVADGIGIRKSVDGGATFARVSRATAAPGIGRIVYFDATNEARQWMGGGVFRTQDDGSTWEQIVDPLPKSVHWASRSRSNVLIGYDAIAPHGFQHTSLSTDGGVTWTTKFASSSTNGSPPKSVVDGSQPGEVYLFQKADGAGAEFIFVSTDDGDSWTQRGPLPAYSLSASASRTPPTVLYYGVDVASNTVGLYRSTDQAVSSVPVTTVPTGGAISAVAVAPSNAAVLYIGYKSPNPYAVYRSDDAGATWHPASSGLGAGAVVSIVVDPASPTTVYAAQPGSGVFRSADGGGTWAAMDEGLGGASEYARALQLDPHDAKLLHFTTDLGNFVVDLSTGAPAGNRRAIEYYYAAFDHYFVSSDLDEIAGLDASVFPGWTRTGESFRVAEASAPGNSPVCRFFSIGFQPLATHFYTPYANECDILKADPNWVYEKIAFGLATPDPVNRGCPPDTRVLYRMYNRNQGGTPNHRYSTHTATFDAMIGQGWIFEGNAETRVFACVPN